MVVTYSPEHLVPRSASQTAKLHIFLDIQYQCEVAWREVDVSIFLTVMSHSHPINIQ